MNYIEDGLNGSICKGCRNWMFHDWYLCDKALVKDTDRDGFLVLPILRCKEFERICPHNWDNCHECRHDRDCIAGLYKPEETTDLEVVIQASNIAEEVMHVEAVESAVGIKKGTWMEEFNRLEEGEIWEWMARYKRPGDINYKEPLKAGPSEPGGGSKSRVPPKPPYKMPEYLKNWGQVN